MVSQVPTVITPHQAVKNLNRLQAWHLIKVHEGENGCNRVDPRISHAINDSDRDHRSLYLGSIDTEEEFLGLQWPRLNSRYVGFLIPPGAPTSLREVAKRFTCLCITFDDLVNGQGQGIPENQIDRPWFKPCAEIEKDFSWDRMRLLVLTSRSAADRNFYLYDGMHRTLALATLLLKHDISFKPFEILLMSPHPTTEEESRWRGRPAPDTLDGTASTPHQS